VAGSPDVDDYLVCATARSGSTLLCGLLESSGVAGHPASYFVRRLLDLAGEQNVDAAPQRVHPRFVPDKPDILVTTSSGVRVPGRLINVSASGAALTVDIPLEPGMRITIGRTPARVARRFEDGIGAAFLEPLSRENVGRHVSL